MIVKPDSVKRYVLTGRPSKVLNKDKQPVVKDGVEEWRYPVLGGERRVAGTRATRQGAAAEGGA